MGSDFELAAYMNAGIEKLVSDIIKSSFKNPKETAFLLKYRDLLKRQQRIKSGHEAAGLHIPAFLISSITDECNLFCKGCYARANGLCGGQRKEGMLSAEEWKGVFKQAADLGISFSLLAGGEPLLRKDVIEAAAEVPEMIFPVFTNGTLLSGEYLKLFDDHRNLVPVISIEGERQKTDERRGDGTYGRLLQNMDSLHKYRLLFGCSITVTTENLDEVTSEDFLDEIYGRGCRLVFYIEYVPVDKTTRRLAPGESERLCLEERQSRLRGVYDKMIFLSFPGDEKYMGGCLAAGRGFFHINPCGDAEACPFSPYSDRNLKEHTMKDVLLSPFFQKLRDGSLTGGEHIGGCTLFEQEDKVRSLLQK